MDTAQDIREFLTSRRAKISPADAEPGPPSHDAMQLLARWATTLGAPAVATDEDHDR
jgi:hypothetical protein